MSGSVTYGPTAWQGLTLCVPTVASVVLVGALAAQQWTDLVLPVVLCPVLVLLSLRQGVRLDDHGVTLLRGPFWRRLRWERVTGLEQTHGPLRSCVVVRTAHDSYRAAYPTDAPLARDPHFLRRAEELTAQVSRRALGGRSPADPR